ncbi:hypothetical protein [Demequina lignilytica]|uniref:Uncharacterized protein n=1 Tax=Demequina lignilytica TaxID=3051663 RepID=A0AB35MJQ3_9MICO|nr:hypothetical protein [Demequina sp. SYSU T0a273]MDN4484046.1 hypothetical protein [Demequina sp. SYSU T0a273]
MMPESASTASTGTSAAFKATAIIAGAAAIGAALWVWQPWASDLAPAASASPTPTATAASSTPSPEPTATASLVDGYAPVAQLPFEAVPWDQVGPGWFAVDYATGRAQDLGSAIAGDGRVEYEQREGGLSLVAPDGTWYAARTHADLGPGLVIAWDGANAWMARAADSTVESVYFDAELVELTDLATASVPAVVAPTLSPFGQGRAVDYAYAGDGLYSRVVGVDTDRMGACGDAGVGFWGWEAPDMSFLYSPAGDGQVICMGPTADGAGTVVTLVDVADVAASEPVATFRLPPDRYAFVGWLDDTTFLVARRALAGGAEAMFQYDVAERAIAEVEAPMYAAVDGWAVTGYYLPGPERHVITTFGDAGWEVQLFDGAGSDVAGLGEACPASPDGRRASSVMTSGDRLLVRCDAPQSVALYSLDDGSEIGRWSLEGTGEIEIFDHHEE